MNKVIRQKDGNYKLHCEDSTVLDAKTWTEKKTVNGKEFVKDWVVLPAGNPTGRTFISRADVDNSGEFEFPTKTSGPRTLGAKLKPEAIAEIEKLQAQIKAIKDNPDNHTVPTKVDPNSEEAILAAMERLMKKLSPEAQAKLAKGKSAK